jgi:1,5-anhydro-D-fructose reductase (1,5-anhydro-D-mannitol-forming)
MVGLGIVGCGVAATDLCTAAQAVPGLALRAAFDVDRARATGLSERFGTRTCADLDELLADDSVDAVYVALPHHLLASTVEASLLSGRHVLAEKPLALDAETATRLTTLAKKTERELGVFFELRDAAPVRWARAALADGAIGTLRTVRISTLVDKPERYWSAAWRTRRAEAGGGVILMNSVHQLDVLRFVTGEEVIRIGAEAGGHTPGTDVEDTVAAALRLSGGAVVSLTAGSRSAGAHDEERIILEGDEGRIDLPYLLSPEPPRCHLRRPWTGLPAGVWTAVPQPAQDCYVESLRAFVAAVRGEGIPSAGGQDAARALEIVHGIYDAAALGQTVSLDPGVLPRP